MDAKTFFLAHFEKLALGLAGLIFGAFLFMVLLQEQPADKHRQSVQTSNQQISRKEELAKASYPKPEVPTAAREVEVALKSPALAKEFPTWLVHKRPVIVYKTEGVDIPTARHFAPNIEASEGSLGSISFRWSDDPRNTLVKVDKYVVKRAEGKEAKDWHEVATIDAGTTSFVDREVKPKTNYFYQVVSYASVDTTHPSVQKVKAKGFDVPLDQAEGVIASPVVGPLQTKPDVKLECVDVVVKTSPEELKQGVPPRTPTAFIKVWKYFPDKKLWDKWQYTTVKVGEMIGKVEQVGSEKRDFKSDFKLVETKTKRVPTKFGETDAPVAVIEDTVTGERFEISPKIPDPELEKIKANPKGDAGGAEEEAPKKKAGEK